ncbi:hypothetical protein MTO96_042609 [Rhipicephalus appendiculatus]
MLRDRLVCGVRDEALQRCLLAETALDFKKAYEKAVTAEYATRQTAATRGALPAASDLHRMDQEPEGHKPGGKQDAGKQSITGRCSRCNGDHDATSCGFRYSVYHFCKREGYIVRACRQKEAARSKAKSGNKRPGKSDRSGVNGLYNIDSALPAFMATVMVNGRQISMEVDSGSVCSIVNLRTLSKLGISKKALRPSSQGVRTYIQQPVWVAGEVEVPVKYNGREGKLPLLVTKGCGISILGRDWFQPLGISLEGLHQLNGAPDYSEVFKPGLGKSTGPPVRIEGEQQATPKFLKPRQVPFALLPKVEEAIEHRIPLPVEDEHEPPLGDILLLEAAPEVPLDSTKKAALTRTALVLSRVHRWILQGWPSGKVPEEFRPFVARKNELSTYRNCVLWGSRVVIPCSAQAQVLDILHTTHPGVVRMKGLARSTVWRLGIDNHIERKGGAKWVPGFITSVTGPLSYQVRLSDASLWRRHVDQIRRHASPLDLGGADSDSGGDTTVVNPFVVGQNPPLPGVSEAVPSSSPPVSPAPEHDNPDVPGSPSH